MSRYRDLPLDCKVYVGNLGSGFEKRELQEAFEKFGPLSDVWVARNPPGFAFIRFENPLDAEDSVRALSGIELCGRRILVDLSRSRPRRGNRGGASRRSISREVSPYRRHGRRDYRSRARSRSPRRYNPSRSRSPRRIIKRTPSRSPRRTIKRTPSRSPRRIIKRTPSRSPRRIIKRTPSRSPRRIIKRTPSRSPRRETKQTLVPSPQQIKNGSPSERRRGSRSSSKSSSCSSRSSSSSSSSSSSRSPSKSPRNDKASPVKIPR